jgi:translation initiation factor 2B subunit (eIF-2B alpha/beta/delta family)
MINEGMLQLSEQFRRLELHAARGGREVRHALLEVVASSPASTPRELLEEVRENVAYLLPCLPPYAPPFNSINQVLTSLEQSVEADDEIEQVKSRLAMAENQTSSAGDNAGRIATFLEPVLKERAVIYTHTLSETVLNTLLELFQRGKVSQVYVTESRPNNDGWDTARRLAEAGIETSLSIDAAMPEVIARADCMLSGAEIINRDGSVVGKVGAYPAALFCRLTSKPVYILADTSKISPFEHARYFLNSFKPADLGIGTDSPAFKVIGQYFDITPPEFIRAVVSEKGQALPQEVCALQPATPVSPWLLEWMAADNDGLHRM